MDLPIALPAYAQISLEPVAETASPPPGGCVTDLYSRTPGQREQPALAYVVDGGGRALLRVRLGAEVRSLRRSSPPGAAEQTFADATYAASLRFRTGMDGVLTVSTATGWRVVAPVRGRQTCAR